MNNMPYPIPDFADPTRRKQKLEQLERKGVVFIDKEHTYMEQDVDIGRGTIVYPNVSIYNGTRIRRNCEIKENTVIRDSIIGYGCQIGPSALIEHSKIRGRSIIGFSTQIKRSFIEEGTYAKHFCYIGDAIIGPRCNIGAGTVFCNYDGKQKNQIVLEQEVFIGSGTMLIAPLRIGQGSYIAANSTVTKDVPCHTLVIARGQRHSHELITSNWALLKEGQDQIHKIGYVQYLRGSWKIVKPPDRAKQKTP